MSDIEISAKRLLDAGEDLVLATIASHRGSTPRTAGAKMIVRRSGGIIGTIGGGKVEAEVIREAAEIFKTGGARYLRYDLAEGASRDSMDLICGGALSVLVEFFPADPANRSFLASWCETVHSGTDAVSVSLLPGKDGRAAGVHRCIVSRQGLISGTYFLSEKQVEAVLREAGGLRSTREWKIDEHHILMEPLQAKASAFIFGAGHVSLALAGLLGTLDFRVEILDDREEFANPLRFDKADRIHVLGDFRDAAASVRIGPEDFVVIVTRGHSHDRTVLAQVLRTPARYIGMIGSRKKRDTIYADILREGFTRRDLERVKCPIGLSIGARSPEEIAVSIAAEIVAVRAGVVLESGPVPLFRKGAQ